MAIGIDIKGPRPMDPLLSAYPHERRNYPDEVPTPDPTPLDAPSGLQMLREDLQKVLRPNGLTFIGQSVDMCA